MLLEVGPIIGSLLMLVALSYLWKHNSAFHAFENMFVGITVAHALIVGLLFIRDTVIGIPGNLTLIIPIILGILLLVRFGPVKYRGFAKIGVSFMIGVSIGIEVASSVSPFITDQVTATFIQLNNVDNIIILIGVICSLSYFTFIIRHRKPTGELTAMGVLARLGRYFLMITFGAIFATVSLARISATIGAIMQMLQAFGIL